MLFKFFWNSLFFPFCWCQRGRINYLIMLSVFVMLMVGLWFSVLTLFVCLYWDRWLYYLHNIEKLLHIFRGSKLKTQVHWSTTFFHIQGEQINYQLYKSTIIGKHIYYMLSSSKSGRLLEQNFNDEQLISLHDKRIIKKEKNQSWIPMNQVKD